MLRILGCLLAVAVFAGCASTEVTGSQPLVNERLPRPNYIWVYDFAATPADVPRGSSYRRPELPSRPAANPRGDRGGPPGGR